MEGLAVRNVRMAMSCLHLSRQHLKPLDQIYGVISEKVYGVVWLSILM